MNEDFLIYLWKSRQFNHKLLTTTEGESIDIIHPGTAQSDAGPDFFNAQVKVHDTRWVGNIEIHIKSSDWLKHQHGKDALYDKVILHVVWEYDQIIKRKDGSTIPTLELKGRVSHHLLDKYKEFKAGRRWVPCEQDIKDVPVIQKRIWMDRLMVERLEQKSGRIKQLLTLNKQDWEASLYQLLARYFGFKVNVIPFELLSSALPFHLLRKYQTDATKVQALLFGQAGFLVTEFKGSYPIQLKKEYEFLSRKHQLEALDVTVWKFMRMRPSNFPTIRLAQFADLISKYINLFQRVREAISLNELRQILEVETHPYWHAHYRFDVPASRRQIKRIGTSSIDVLIINAIVPLLFTYADFHGNEEMKERAFHYLQQVNKEKNSIIKRWKS